MKKTRKATEIKTLDKKEVGSREKNTSCPDILLLHVCVYFAGLNLKTLLRKHNLNPL